MSKKELKVCPQQGFGREGTSCITESSQATMANGAIEKIDNAVSYSKLCFLLFPSLTAPMVRNLPLVSRLNVLMAICIHLSLCQHCFKFNTRYL